MPLPPDIRTTATEAVERFCARQGSGLGDQLRYEHTVRGDAITIVERRAPWRPEAGPEWTTTKVAQLRYSAGGRWRLYAFDGSSRRIDYPYVGPARDVQPLLDEIARDPTGIFFG